MANGWFWIVSHRISSHLPLANRDPMSAPSHSGKTASPLTAVQWLICIIASIGFAFDTYELLMAPLIIPDAVREFYGQQQAKEAAAKKPVADAGKPADEKAGEASVAAATAAPPAPSPEAAKAAAVKRTKFVRFWQSAMFFLPAICGGVFGLLGGYLTDRLGRRRVLTWSILLYAFGAFAAGFSTSLYMLLFFRCLVFVGVCVEFVAAVAWLAELFDNPIQREKVLGYTQAFSSVGGLLVALAYACASAWSIGEPASLFFGIKIPYVYLPDIHLPSFLNFFGGEIADHKAAWRYTLMSGVLPAIPLILVRPFLPESNSWQEKLASGKLRRPSFAELFAPNLRKTTIVTAIMFACSLGAAFGSIQQIPGIVPGLPEVQAEQKKAVAEAVAKADEAGKPLTPMEKKAISDTVARKTAAEVTKVQEIGGLVGRFALAGLAVVVVSRRSLLRIFQIPGLIIIPLVFGYAAINNLSLLYVGMFLAGFCTVAQLSFWGNYLPLVYPVHLRGTGESFAANIGGRLIGTSMAAVVTFLATVSFIPGEAMPDGGISPTKMAYAAAIVGTSMYLIGSIACFFLPEPKPEAFDE